MALFICSVEPPPPIETLPILVTWYDPALGGINCGGGCDTLADGTKWNGSHYYTTAACLVEWRGGVVVFGDYSLTCRDTGGAIKRSWNEHYQRWVVHVDILAPADNPPACNYCLYYDWELLW